MSMTTDPQLIEALREHRRKLGERSLLDLFRGDTSRLDRFSLTAAGLTLDFSKNYCDDATLALFAQIAERANSVRAAAALMEGAEANPTEHRAALHTALRSASPPLAVRDEIQQTLARLSALTAAVRSGRHTGFTGQPLTDIVNVGIGGSDLGPRMAVAALKQFQTGLRLHFVANIDPVELDDTLAPLNPATTLIITASKSFTTLETLANSLAARRWLTDAAAGRDIGPQLIAITANPEKARHFGIEDSNIFPMWDWVGGRFSLWSAIGLPIALAVGWENFQAFQRGAAAMDEHYRSAEPIKNMPMLLALLECWYLNYWDAHSIAVLPYSHRLRLFPAFLQQLSMESLGKSTTLTGAAVAGHTGAVIWGEPGTNSQHSFMQLLHQGTRLVPVDFILPLQSETMLREQHAHLVANCLSQSRALMVGKSRDNIKEELDQAGMSPTTIAEQLPHRVLRGNQPSNTITMGRLEPFTLGALIALYEHKVHAQSILWGINAFDQWGVELGKKIEGEVFPLLSGGNTERLDASTRHLVEQFRRANRNS